MQTLRQAAIRLPDTALPEPALETDVPLTGNLPGEYLARVQSVALDTTVLRGNRVLTGTAPAGFAEPYRLLRTQILNQFRGKGLNSLALTSPRDGAGKTLTALNLAISMSQLVDCRVLLVDMNLQAPALLAHLGVPEGWGLGDHLVDDMPLERLLIRPDGYGNLMLLPAGEPLVDTTSLLDVRRMKQLVSDLNACAPGHLVVLDLPSVLGSSGTSALCRQTDATLLVVEDGVSTKQDTRHALEMLAGVTLAGTVLNKVPEMHGSRRRRSGGWFG